MLIMTQTKEAVNLDNVETVYAWPDSMRDSKGYYVFARGVSGEKIRLGWYESKERAEEVLTEIVETQEEETRSRAYKMPHK